MKPITERPIIADEEIAELLSRENDTHGAQISTELKVMYMDAPKCGSTTIKYMVQSAHYLCKNEITREFNSHLIHFHAPFIRLSNFSNSAQSTILKSPEFFRFCFVRNPYTRILSCYLSGVANTLSRKSALFACVEGAPLALEAVATLNTHHFTFKGFLQAIKKQREHEMDIHWRPQNHLLATSLVSYDFIGCFERLEQDMDYIRQKLFPTLTLPIPKAPWPMSTEKRFWDYYDDECLQLVAEIYKNDFKEFGYPLNQWPVRESTCKVV